jgi:hypothetical protein
MILYPTQLEPFTFELALPSDVLLSKKQAKIELENINQCFHKNAQ